MRAAFVLALVLGLASPSLTFSELAAPSKPGVSAMGSAAGAAAKLVRDTAKAEKSLSGAWLAVGATSAPHAVFEHVALIADQTSAPPSLALDAPPLGPRPPPLS